MTVIFFIASIIFFLTIDWIMRRTKAQKIKVTGLQTSIEESNPLRVPQGIFFAKSHTWLNLFPSGKIRLGVDDFVRQVLHNPEIILTRRNGEHIKKGEPILLLKEDNNLLTVRSPIEGEIVSTNGELSQNPNLLKKNLFSDGWAYTIKPARADELRQLLIGEETRLWMQEELRRLREFLTGKDSLVLAQMLPDGGKPIIGAMKSMDNSEWKRFEEEFLQVQ
jgi:glycine cleavage system H lipoate-binding protein